MSPVAGAYNWIQYLADYRRYDPIIFNYLTIATRAYADLSIGPDETEFQKYIARPDYVRGYDRNSNFSLSCPVVGANPSNCSAVQLLGSRVAVANVEVRFPLVRRRGARISAGRAAAAGRLVLLRRRDSRGRAANPSTRRGRSATTCRRSGTRCAATASDCG